METCKASDLKERHIKSIHLVGIVERETFWIFLKKVYAVLIGPEYAVNSLFLDGIGLGETPYYCLEEPQVLGGRLG